MKTNAVRLLESLGVQYELREYEVDPDDLAAETGDRKMELVPVKELLGLTGYIRGGVTVLGAKKAFPVFADETIQLWEAISISAGVRGTQMILRPDDYMRVTEAVMADIGQGK